MVNKLTSFMDAARAESIVIKFSDIRSIIDMCVSVSYKIALNGRSLEEHPRRAYAYNLKGQNESHK